MELTAVLIPADTEQPIKRLTLTDPDYKTYQGLVGGLIDFLDAGHASLCFHDEGKLIGQPANPRATGLMWLLRPEFAGVDFMVGDVVVLGQPDENGDTTSAPIEYVEFLAD